MNSACELDSGIVAYSANKIVFWLKVAPPSCVSWEMRLKDQALATTVFQTCLKLSTI